MSFDALTMHAIKDELESVLVGGQVEKVLALSPLEIGLRVWSHHRTHNLLISADAQSARVHLITDTLRRLTDDVTPFLLLLRKYVRDGRITAIEQPPLERVLKLVVENRLDDGEVSVCRLIIEVMGRHSNVILEGSDSKVLDALKRIPQSLSRQRIILPHQPYFPPPPVEKLSPLSTGLASQLMEAASALPPGASFWRFLQESVNALGPLASREVSFRACGDSNATISCVQDWGAVVVALEGLFEPIRTRAWQPCVVVQEGAVIHFAPYLLTQFPGEMVEKVDSISAAIERSSAERLHTRPNEALRAPLRASIQVRLDRARKKEESLVLAATRGEKAEGLKRAGQAILASTGTISPGQTELEWEGETIRLDPKLSPSENAQALFKSYTKARDAAREIPALLESARREREYLELMLLHAELAEGEPELRGLSREITDYSNYGSSGPPKPVAKKGKFYPGKGGQKKPEQPAGTVKKVTSPDGFPILIGGSAKGNERATFDLGTSMDMWLHARQIPGAHVIVKSDGREIPQRTLLQAARLAAAHSQARGSGRVPVDYTLQRYVKKVKGGPPGLVTYSQEKTLRVEATETGSEE